jgi:acyl-CoA reductase-like NAD-dependent aldehyde dehydrogenase
MTLTATPTLEVENPATGDIIATVPNRTPEQVAQIVAKARLAQPVWQEMGFDDRGAVLRRCRQWVLDNSERVIATISEETGKTYEDALIAEVSYIVHALGFWADKASKYLADQRIRSK